MEESSSAFTLAPPFSRCSPTSGEEKLGNPLQRALTTSVSFGRFMSESLDWERWSAFTQNKYLEDVEKYSRPGAVAEKKAYFEAHFKRRRAAALLEQQNAAAGNEFSESNTDNMAVCSEGTLIEGNQEINALENEGSSGDIALDNEHKRNEDGSAENNEISSDLPFVENAISVNLKRQSTSLHMSINFGSSGGIHRTASPSLKKLENPSRITKPPVKNYGKRGNSTKINVNNKFSHHSASSLPPEKKTTTTQRGDSILRNRIEDMKSQTSSIRYSQSSNKFGNAKSPSSFSSFTLKTQERAEKRKEKLEEKLRLKEAEKKQQIRSQAKTRSSYNDLCKTPPMPKFPTNLTKEASAVKSAKMEDRVALKVQNLESRPPWRVSSKMVQGTKKEEEEKTIHWEKRISKRSMNENASPNIPS